MTTQTRVLWGGVLCDGVLAGGASSPVRAASAVGGPPFIQTGGAGAYAFDDQGHRRGTSTARVMCVRRCAPALFGHARRELVGELEELAAMGTVFGWTHPEEIRLAERIAAHLPSMMERLPLRQYGNRRR